MFFIKNNTRSYSNFKKAKPKQNNQSTKSETRSRSSKEQQCISDVVFNPLVPSATKVNEWPKFNYPFGTDGYSSTATLYLIV